MSSMISTPPPSIQIGGGGPSGGPGGASGPSGGSDTDPVAALKAALQKLSDDAVEVTRLAHDPNDKQTILKIATEIHALIAAHQKEEDSIMGGGPGASMLRRSTPPSNAA